MKRKFCIDNQWEQRVRNYSYCRTAHAFKIVRRLWPKESPLYAIVSKELRRKALRVFSRIGRQRIVPHDRHGFEATCMMKMMSGIDRFRPANFYRWLATIACNEAVDRYRKLQRTPALLSAEQMADAPLGSPDRTEWDRASATLDFPDEVAVVAEFLERVEVELGPDAREILEDRMAGRDLKSIAASRNLEVRRVRSILGQIAQLYNQYSERPCAA